MEPGFLKPGNSNHAVAPPPCCFSFNGARLPEARKRGSGQERPCQIYRASMEPGFLKPGNARVPRAPGGPLEASMEPGFLKPGNATDGRALAIVRHALQWSQAS